MIAAIMQPYFFPYIGYFQLMKAADVFVIYDDAQYMKGGWINRNRIRINGSPFWLTIPTRRDGVSLRINQRHYLLGPTIERAKKSIHAGYARAPAYTETAPAICELLDFSDDNIAHFNTNLLTTLARKLDIGCSFATSSAMGNPNGLKGEDRVIDLCLRLGADHYINPIGGASLYDVAHFASAGLKLSFLRTTATPVTLDSGPQHLSVIDGLMHHGFPGYRQRLPEYVLEDGQHRNVPA